MKYLKIHKQLYACYSAVVGYDKEEVFVGGYTGHVANQKWWWEDGSRWSKDSQIWADNMPVQTSGKTCVAIHHEKSVKNVRCTEARFFVCEIAM